MKSTKIMLVRVLIVLLLLSNCPVFAQNSQGLEANKNPIDELRAQIQVLESIVLNPSTSSSVLEFSKNNLATRHKKLINVLKQEINSLRAYQTNSFLSKEEKNEILSQIQEMEQEKQSLETRAYANTSTDLAKLSPQDFLGKNGAENTPASEKPVSVKNVKYDESSKNEPTATTKNSYVLTRNNNSSTNQNPGENQVASNIANNPSKKLSGNASSGSTGSTSSASVKTTLKIEVKEKDKLDLRIPVEKATVKLRKLDTSIPDFVDVNSFSIDTDKDGKVEVDNFLSPGNYKVVVEKGGYYQYVQSDQFEITSDNPGMIEVKADLIPLGSGYYRAIIGAEQGGSSSQKSQQNVFLNFYFSVPLPTPISKDYKDPRLKFWGDARITGVPKQSQNLFKALTGGNLSSSLSSSISDISDSRLALSFLAGLQFRVGSGRIIGKKTDVSLIAGGGGITPIATDDTVQLFKVPDRMKDTVRFNQLKSAVNNAAGSDLANALDDTSKKDVAFVLRERDRFFRNYYGGVRIETYFGSAEASQPPALFDAMVGQDESVTGGRVQSAVLRLDGFFPLPIGKAGTIFLFGSASLALKRSKSTDPLLLPTSDSTVTATSPSTLVVPVNAANRDLFRLGIGVDIVRLIKNNTSSGGATTSTAANKNTNGNSTNGNSTNGNNGNNTSGNTPKP